MINSLLKWTYIAVHDFSVNKTDTFTVSIPKAAKEIYIEYGNKNQNQIYSGGALILITNSQYSHPSFVPSYNGDSLVNIYYMFLLNWSLSIYKQWGTPIGRVAVYYR